MVSTPKVKQESVNLAVKTLVNVEKSKNGKALLEKLSNMKLDDLDGLNDLLDKWTVGDALEVLNEIDRRLAVIVAIRKLAGDNTTDELHVLHPMIAESRWLFGPEYESSEYIFNRQMRTAVSQVFGEDKFQRIDINEKKRPDLVIMPDSTIGVTGLEEIPEETSIVRVRHLLLIELKKGAFEKKRKEKTLNSVNYGIDKTVRGKAACKAVIHPALCPPQAQMRSLSAFYTKLSEDGFNASRHVAALVPPALVVVVETQIGRTRPFCVLSEFFSLARFRHKLDDERL